MELSKPIRWREGMPVRPQHFQQRDLAQEAREVWLRRTAEPHWWGLEYIELGETQLDNFTLDVKALRAVLPGGTLVDVPGNARLPGRVFSEHMTEAGRSLPVRLGVRMREERAGQTAGPGGAGAGAEARYVPLEEEVRDLETGRDPFPVEKLVLDARLFFGDEQANGYETLSITALQRTGNPSKPVVVDTSFAPPCLALAASPALTATVRGVVDALVRALRNARDRGWEDPIKPIVLQAMAAATPVLRDMVTEGHVHPAVAARELSRLAGALTIQRDKGRTEDDIPAYRHDDPGGSLKELTDLVIELITWADVERFKRLPMTAERDLLVAQLASELRRPGCRYFLEIAADESSARVPALVATAKVSAPNRIDMLKTRILPGVATEAMTGPPPELPPGAKGMFFRLKTDEGAEWSDNVLPDGNVAVWFLQRPADLRINLIVVMPKG